MSPTSQRAPSQPSVAIIGMGCVFPKAPNLKGYWRLLHRGEDAIGPVPPTHWSASDYYDADPKRPDHVYCTRGGFIDPVDFDPTEFGIPPSNIEATDTSQLLSLMAARMALDDAGYGENGRTFDGARTSVILGITGTQELVIPLGARLGYPLWRRAMESAGVRPEVAEEAVQQISDAYVGWQENSFPGLLGNVVAGRISNRFNLGGTNCVVDAACASSFSAVHLGLLELWARRSDMVLTGGADLLNDIFMHMCFAKTQILSPSGDARPFSKDADGTVLGEGVGLVILKRLADAERDGDRIYAVIRSIGTSSDGRSNSIYAPGVEGQVAALRRAYDAIDLDPADIDLVEAHGTGTRVGDRVEVTALNTIFGGSDARASSCALGSVKSMIGHTKAAAGAAGLIKAALALHHKVLPPTIKIDAPDPELALDSGPFYLNTRSRPWPSSPGRPRRCGVSAFGFGGSNFHLVLEEHRTDRTEPAWDDTVRIFALSGEDPADLRAKVAAMADELAAADSDDRARIAQRTCAVFDAAAPERLVAVAAVDECPDRLSRAAAVLASGGTEFPQGVFVGSGPPTGSLAVLFPGQGSQYPGMGRELACIFPEFLCALEAMAGAFSDDLPFFDLVYPKPVFGKEPEERQHDPLQRTDRAQAAIGGVSLGWYRVLSGFGLAPAAAAGHSFGELTALCAADRIDAATFARLAVARGRAMASAGAAGGDAGAMLAVRGRLAELEALPLPEPDLCLVNRNSPNQGVFAGPTPAIERLADRCRERKLRAVRLPVSAAFHSPLIQGAHAPFGEVLVDTEWKDGRFPVYGNTHAVPYPSEPSAARRILSDQMLRPVDFVAIVENLHADGVRTFLEVGPKGVLTGLVSATLRDRPHTALAVDRSGGRKDGLTDLALTLAHLAALGYPLALSRWDPPPGQRRAMRMRIPLSGANYRSPRKTDPPAPARRPAQSDAGPAREPSMVRERKTAPTSLPSLVQTDRAETSTMETHTFSPSPSDGAVGDALRSVEAGLRAIEQMQAQTAAAHQKFLETQQEASRALVEMMASARRMSDALLGNRSAPAAAPVEPAPPPADTTRQEPDAPADPAPVPSLATPPAEPATVTSVSPSIEDADRPPAAGPVVSAATEPLAESLFAVVAELTGYPREMLTAEMEIEADLGIDSIKRVEILSALEERISGLPTMAPEQMGGLSTLGDIVAVLAPADQGKAPPPPVAATDETPGPSPDSEAVASVLYLVVAELTGYPVEMLTAEMEIEADLGIDSIKRVEILSALEERVSGLPPLAPEQMGGLKTLGDIAACLTPADTGAPPPDNAMPPNDRTPATGSRRSEGDGSPAALDATAPRQVLRPRPLPRRDTTDPDWNLEKPVWIAGDATLGPAVAAALTGHGMDARYLAEDQVAAMLRPEAAPPQAAGLVYLAPGTGDPEESLYRAFALTRSLAPALIQAAADGGALLATVSRLDGAFGFLGQAVHHPLSGGLAGLVKTAALEMTPVRCRALDLSADWTDTAAAAAIARELAFPDPGEPVEIGLTPDARLYLESGPAPYRQGRLTLQPGEVVVATGGARGVTAEALVALAGESRATCVLLGRSPLPAAEPEWLAGLETPADIQQALLQNEFRQQTPSPRRLGQRCRQILAQREVRANLERMVHAGATAVYHSLDVRRPDDLKAALDTVRRDHGPIRALVHGAGTLHDRRIVDKTDEQFRTVFDTKVTGLRHLLDLTRDDPLRYIVLFSSVAARTGNIGQVDYAMANEVLNKVARQTAVERPTTRVLSINWGPWDGGMVDAGLRRHFTSQGVRLLDPAAGAAAMVRCMAEADLDAVEIVVGSGLPATVPDEAASPPPCPPENEELHPAFEQKIDLEGFPVLADHVIGGRPVVPLALMVEWLGHTALHANPGLSLVALEDLRLLNGIKLDGHSHPVRLMTGPSVAREGCFEVPVALFNGNGNGGPPTVHSRARAVLADLPPSPPPPAPALKGLAPFSFSVAEAYAQVLFHGKRLHGIRAIDGCSSEGMTARLATAPAPDRWLRQPLRSRWVTDPLVIDAAFQMAILWCYETQGMLSLPSAAQSYRQYCRQFPDEGVAAEMRVREVSKRRLTADFTFLDNERQVVASLTGYEAIMDPALDTAFKHRRAA